MFTATMEWVLINNTDIAERFMRSKNKKVSPAYVRWIYSRLTINDNEQEALWEASMMFLADKASKFVGKAFEDEQAAKNYVFRSFHKWFIDETRRLQRHDIKFVSIEELTIIGENEMEREGKMEEIVKFVCEGGAQAEFFMHYLMMGKEEQGQFWLNDRKQARLLDKIVSKQTFYTRLHEFKVGLKTFLENN
jgi:hypothetical protein